MPVAGLEGRDVTMEVVVSGSSLRCGLLEAPEATIAGQDSRYPTGTFGVKTYNAEAAFESIHVYAAE